MTQLEAKLACLVERRVSAPDQFQPFDGLLAGPAVDGPDITPYAAIVSIYADQHALLDGVRVLRHAPGRTLRDRLNQHRRNRENLYGAARPFHGMVYVLVHQSVGASALGSWLSEVPEEYRPTLVYRLEPAAPRCSIDLRPGAEPRYVALSQLPALDHSRAIGDLVVSLRSGCPDLPDRIGRCIRSSAAAGRERCITEVGMEVARSCGCGLDMDTFEVVVLTLFRSDGPALSGIRVSASDLADVPESWSAQRWLSERLGASDAR